MGTVKTTIFFIRRLNLFQVFRNKAVQSLGAGWASLSSTGMVGFGRIMRPTKTMVRVLSRAAAKVIAT